jgi:hypothetical protein
LPPPSVGLSFASAERASPRSKTWKIEAPPPSRSEKRRHPVITYREGGLGKRPPSRAPLDKKREAAPLGGF